MFPGAVPLTPSTDADVFVRQTGQSAPTSALLGKPARCACMHGVAQAYSLDPMPPPPSKGATARINSGLLKLTCPLLVRAVDELEDLGAMGGLNERLAEDGDWRNFLEEAHEVHARARRELVFGQVEDGESFDREEESEESSAAFQLLQSKLGDRGAQAFLQAGVAGASPGLDKPDVKCLHAWLADYLFRDDGAGDDEKEHPLGQAVVQALASRGVDVAGTESCRVSCIGPLQNDVEAASSFAPPVPRNKQRKKGAKESARKQRRKLEEREVMNN